MASPIWASSADVFTDARASGSPPEPVGLDDLLNIQYTSGTTGFPKGVLQAQRYWITQSRINAFRDGLAYERILISTPFYYMDPQWLLAEFGSLPEVLAAPRPELERCVSPACAARLALAHDLARRLLEAPLRVRPLISSWSAVTAYLRGVLTGLG